MFERIRVRLILWAYHRGVWIEHLGIAISESMARAGNFMTERMFEQYERELGITPGDPTSLARVVQHQRHHYVDIDGREVTAQEFWRAYGGYPSTYKKPH